MFPMSESAQRGKPCSSIRLNVPRVMPEPTLRMNSTIIWVLVAAKPDLGRFTVTKEEKDKGRSRHLL